MAPPTPPPGKRRPAAWYRYAQASSVGLEMGLSVAVGVGAGLYLEGRFGGAPWVGLAGLAFGIGAAALAVVRASQRHREGADPSAPTLAGDGPADRVEGPGNEGSDRSADGEGPGQDDA